MSALGDTFRTMRESQGLSLSDVAERIHIRSVYLAAIEAEDWTSIGPPVYVRGFLRSYARALGLDPDEVIAQFAKVPGGSAPLTSAPGTPARAAAPPRTRQRVEVTRTPPPLMERDTPRRPGLSLGAIVGVLVALALVVFVGYEYMEYSQGGMVAQSPPATTQAGLAPRAAEQAGGERAAPVEPAATPRATAKSPDERSSGFAVRLRDSSWLRVIVDGKVAMEGLYPKGTQRTFAGRSATVRVGNAGGVDISVDGKDLGPMGGLGDVAERSYQL
jgi:cytoskeletal protein RodZ